MIVNVETEEEEEAQQTRKQIPEDCKSRAHSLQEAGYSTVF
jgi:hypothetical protein